MSRKRICRDLRFFFRQQMSPFYPFLGGGRQKGTMSHFFTIFLISGVPLPHSSQKIKTITFYFFCFLDLTEDDLFLMGFISNYYGNQNGQITNQPHSLLSCCQKSFGLSPMILGVWRVLPHHLVYSNQTTGFRG